jgi:hypothetical protein
MLHEPVEACRRRTAGAHPFDNPFTGGRGQEGYVRLMRYRRYLTETGSQKHP